MLALFAVLAFLFPIGVYCLVLAGINRRSSPLLVSGLWDTVGLLFAGSGVFLVTIPALLIEFYHRSIIGDLTEPFSTLWWRYWLLWLCYFLLLISGSTYLLLWRRHKTMVYNVDPELFLHILEATLEPIGLEATMQKQQMMITAAAPVESAETAVREGLPAVSPPPPPSQRHALLAIEAFPALCHVTVHWRQYDPEVRRDIERQLEKHLENAAPPDNPAASWFLMVSGLVFGMLTMIFATVLFLIFTGR